MAGDVSRETQVAVIGGGPGGYAAAFQAAELGLKVVLISDDPQPGGVCLLRGCIPSKALLHVARLLNETRDAHAWGVTFGKPQIDLNALREWKNGVVGKLAAGVTELCRRRHVEFIHARATFADGQTLRLQAKGQAPVPDTIRFEHAVLASGSSPAMPGILKVDDPRVMDSTMALALTEVPERLLVVGGGYIGLELGSVYAALGSRVTVVELTDGLLPGVDRDLVRALQARLAKTFEAIHLKSEVLRLEPQKKGIAMTIRGEGAPPEQVFDRVLVAVGRRPNSSGLGLENTGVQVDAKGFVAVDPQMRTSDPHIFAIGDVTGEPMLAHRASRQAKVAAEVIAGKGSTFDNVTIPAVVFTDPEIAWCGLTETQAKTEKREIAVARFPWAASGRAATLGRTEGLTKLIFDPQTERLLGVGIVGVGAGELIAEGVVAIEMAAVAHDVAASIHPHPTLSETIMESAEAFFGLATHLFRPKR